MIALHNTRIVLLIAFGLVAMMPSAKAKAQGEAAQNSVSTGIKLFDVDNDPAFSNYAVLLNKWVFKHSQSKGNDFCVLGYVSGDASKAAYAYWLQGQKIFVWAGASSPLDLNVPIDLRTDVVDKASDIHGSTYLVSKAWVVNLQKHATHMERKSISADDGLTSERQ